MTTNNNHNGESESSSSSPKQEESLPTPPSTNGENTNQKPNGETNGTPELGGERDQPPPPQQGDNHHHSNKDQEEESTSHVSRATYPIPQPLARLLKATIVKQYPQQSQSQPAQHHNNSNNKALAASMLPTTTEYQIPSLENALRQLVGNSFEALDGMYFGTFPTTRNRPSFAHRLCLRVSVSPSRQTLTLTDLGNGMTRADLINTLGIGQLSFRALQSSQKIMAMAGRQEAEDDGPGNSELKFLPEEDDDDEEEEDEKNSHADHDEDDADDDENNNNDDDDNDDDDEKSTEGDTDEEEFDEDEGTDEEEDEYEDDDDEEEEEAESSKSTSSKGSLVLPCRPSDIGGFYSALCALGTGVNVGTKSKYDDYYEFEVGESIHNTPKKEEEPPLHHQEEIQQLVNFTHFRICRPMPEGTRPTVQNGYTKFEDVRGDSGTRVTIQLNKQAIDAGFLQEDTLKPLLAKILETSQYSVAFSTDTEEAQTIIDASFQEDQDNAKNEAETDASTTAAGTTTAAATNNEDSGIISGVDLSGHGSVGPSPPISADPGLRTSGTVRERSKYIPLRLSLGERKMLRLVEAAMTCCDYTTEVDKPFKSQTRRTHAQLKRIAAILRGLVTACDYSAGQKLLDDENYAEFDVFFRQMFEIARRHKIMNPEKMRTEYGKLIYLLQDAVSPSVQPHLEFSVKGRIESVYKFLEERGGLAVLDDKLIEIATEEILAGKKSRAKINAEIKRKEKAVKAIKQKYHTTKLNAEDIHLCLYSVCDNNSFLNSDRVPIDKVLDYLSTHFSPGIIEEGYSLSIVSGEDGARLSHSHEKQYYYALQSLTLWRDITDDMFRLWCMAEEDLLSETITYSLQDTGQGMQRVQQSPRTYKAMQQILARVQSKVSHWIGSSVIHMGDHNVPNALSFIDKYTQVPRILGPIVSCLENLERIVEEDDGIKEMVEGFGGYEKVRKDILYDFFKSAFDGSGADNFYDAGSCIDGRLTSAWNWCSQLPTKDFYLFFKLTGFTGFDGAFYK